MLIFKGLTQTLDHHLLLSDEFIHQQGATSVSRFHHDHDSILRLHRPHRPPEIGSHSQDGSLFSPHTDHLSAFLNRGDHSWTGTEGFPHGKCGDDITIVSDAYHQAINDRQSQGQDDREGRSLSGNRLNLHFPPEIFNIPPNHIHAHSPSGKICDFFGRGKTG